MVTGIRSRPSLKLLKVRQVDAALEPFQLLRGSTMPTRGWSRVIREALGMSLRQFAARMGVAKQTATALERNEAGGTVRIGSLRRMANALNCDLVYALVPRTSVEGALRDRARTVARQLVSSVSASMELEAQGVGALESDRQVDELTESLLFEWPRDLWDDPA